ncbi:MAG: hypothetical protein JWM50_691 [Microbacteriaceae bacterium]|jgi:hypothetical protein|nr:hypothetical protein [Microbacteriaceae bacterium]
MDCRCRNRDRAWVMSGNGSGLNVWHSNGECKRLRCFGARVLSTPWERYHTRLRTQNEGTASEEAVPS